ncbi:MULTISPECIES: hypothetical protein [unclassified Methanosarcina]|uniref:hypothetical protein n=1 Tax=unclassified Methanosarcina TaxID=2644672 RepID=UPI00064EC3EE|nr:MULTISPECIES: hypothetical protein [unclassified Methanosarcina]
MAEYVHGYSEREALRLSEQAETLEKFLHYDTIYLPGAKVLEAGCGINRKRESRKPREQKNLERTDLPGILFVICKKFFSPF